MAVVQSPPSSFGSVDGDVHLAMPARPMSFGSDEGGAHRVSAAKEFAMLALGLPQAPRPAEPREAEHSKLKTRAKNLVGLLKRKSPSAGNSAASTRASTAKSTPDNSWKPAGEEPIKTEFFD